MDDVFAATKYLHTDRMDGPVPAEQPTAEPAASHGAGSGRVTSAFPLLIESTTDYAIFMLDADGYIATWNAGAERIKGYTREEIVGKHFSIFYPPEAIARKWPQTELELAAKEGRFEDEGWRLRKDGSRFWANVVITALRDTSGKLIGFGKVSRDLTERRLAEQDLRESEERFRLIVENTLDYGLFMLHPDGRVASWNAGAQRIKGYTAEEIIGRHFSVFYTAEANARQWPQFELQEAARVGRFEDEGWRVRKDGTMFWANVVITALRSPDGELRGFGKITRDVSERKAHQERIEKLTRELERRVTELAATNRELMHKTSENESFVYSVSHDLRAPLVNLQGFSQELMLTKEALVGVLADERVPTDVRARAEALLNTELTESLGFIRNSVQHLSNIIDGLLRLSRIGRIEYDAVPVDVRSVVSDILASMHPAIAQANATVDVGPLPTVSGDRNAIGQIFANIVGNALKSLSPHRPGVIRIEASADDPPVFAIRDNGIGIPENYRKKIFQVFQHVHPGKGGEGMGLAIVRRIVERHGGRIWFESVHDVGTTFFFTLAPADGREEVAHG
jgi:PAS domain S-box-containing protein